MRRIKLTQSQYAMVDNEDYKYLNQWRWQASWQPNINSYYAVRTERTISSRKTVMMHRQIMKTPLGLQCDHKKHNTLDNRKKNLRNCTQTVNQANRDNANSNNKLGILGVCRVAHKFHAFIKRNNKSIRIGQFDTLEEAKNARVMYQKEITRNG